MGTVTGRRTTLDLLTIHARLRPDQPYILFEDEVTTYAGIDRDSRAVAAWLRANGAAPGDRVVLHMGNRPQFMVALLGILRAGCVAVPTNILYKSDELAYAMSHAEAAALISEARFIEVAANAIAAVGMAGPTVYVDEPSAGSAAWEEVARGTAGQSAPEVDVKPASLAAIMYTSGTTARPKGVMLTHDNLLYVALATAQQLGLSDDDRPLLAFPLFHVNSLAYGALTTLVLGGQVALLAGFSPSRWWDAVRRYQATWNPGLTGPMLRLLLQREETPEDRAHTLRLAVCGMVSSVDELEAFERRFGVRLIPGFSSTETVVYATATPHYGPRPRDPTLIGLPTLGQEVRVVDEGGQDCAVGLPGELVFRSQSMIAGYFKDPEATAKAIRDGWLWTGDMAREDEDGFFYFVDRKKDMIKTKVENVAAAEVERVLNAHPALAESAVVGVPEPEGLWGERVEAFVILRPEGVVDEETLRSWCDQRLASFKVPRFVHFVADFPRTPIGKVKKNELRAAALRTP